MENTKKRFQKIYIEILNTCNLKCEFCTPTNRKNKIMTVEEFENVINKIKDYTNIITLHVKGEPLLHPNLKEILEKIDKTNLKVNITTNGILVKKQLEVLKKSKCLRQLNISLHSFSQNEKIEYNLQNYMENILFSVRKLKKNNIYISYRLWNLKDIKENNENIEILEKLSKEYNIENLIQKARENEFVELDKNIFLNQDKQFKWPNINDKTISNIGKCYGLRKQIAILSNGDVVPCCLDQDANILLGNIFESDLESIINSEKSIKIIKGFEENKLICKLCQKCDYIKKFNNFA